MILDKYKEQVDLLLQILPYVAKENMFALKGGTAFWQFFLCPNKTYQYIVDHTNSQATHRNS